jgi:multiple sugar transport system ATP-binding protein
LAEIVLTDVTKRYPDGFEAVKQMNLEIADGEFMILVGPSGCGKSTALRMIAGLEEITAGDLLIGGEVVNDLPPRDRDVAMVFQNYALYPHMSVRENMGFALKLAKIESEEIDKRVREAADILDLTEHLDRKPANLSGGQRQRVAMGRAIVRDPAVFLMDEPLSNLDAKLRVQMRTQVSRIQQRLGTTTVYVTHDQTEAMTLGDRVAVMRAGVIQQVDRPEVLYERPQNLFVAGFIGSPAMHFMPGHVQGGKLVLPMVEIDVPPHLRDLSPDTHLVVGMRPEHMEDAAVLSDAERSRGATFRTKIEVLESVGSDLFAYFTIETEGVDSEELKEIAEDAGTTDVPREAGANQAVARLSAESKVRRGQEAELWLDTQKLHFFDGQTGRALGERELALAR